MERMCVVMDGQESVPDFFLEIQVELRKSHFAHSFKLFTELQTPETVLVMDH